MTHRVIIAGGDRVGARTASILGEYGHDPIIVEQDSDRCTELADRRHGIVVNGDATRAAIIDQCGPERADAFAALMGDPATNRRLCDRFVKRYPDVRTVARTPDPAADVGSTTRSVVPALAGTKAAATTILGYSHDILDVPASGLDIAAFAVDPGAPAAHRRLDEIALPRGSQVIADAETCDVAGPATELRPDRRYLVAFEPGVAADLRNLLRA